MNMRFGAGGAGRWSVVVCLTVVGLVASSASHALTIYFEGWEDNFNNVTDSPKLIGALGQLSVEVDTYVPTDPTESSDPNRLFFRFSNSGTIPSVIAEIYFYDTAATSRLDFSAVDLPIYGSDGVKFVGGANPGNLPNQINPVYKIEAKNPAPGNGVGPGDILTVAPVSWGGGSTTLEQAYKAGTILIGLHVTGIGATEDVDGDSDWFISSNPSGPTPPIPPTPNPVVPEPATLALFGVGLLGLGVRRRMGMKSA